MLKRIVRFVVFFAFFASSVSVDAVVGKKSNDLKVALEKHSLSGANFENISATAVGGEGSLLAKNDATGEYILTDDVTITRAGAAVNPTYQALLDILNIKSVKGAYTTPEKHVILDGRGYTITTEIPLLDVIGNCTVKNLNVIADNNAETDVAEPIKLTNDDIFVYKTNYHRVGVIAAVTYGDITFEHVTVSGGLDYSGDDKIYGVVAMGGFVGSREAKNKLQFESCTNNVDLNIAPGASAAANTHGVCYEVRLSVGGFVGMAYSNNAGCEFSYCANNGDITLTNIHNVELPIAGGFIGTAYGANCNINYSLNTGDITVNQEYNDDLDSRIGGFAGRIGNGDIKYCINLGNLTLNIPDGVAHQYNIGGIVGSLMSVTKATQIVNCLNAGDIYTSSAYDQPLAGIVGLIRYDFKDNIYFGTYKNLINIGRVESKCEIHSSRAQIIGHAYGSRVPNNNTHYYINYSNIAHKGAYAAIKPYGNKSSSCTANELNNSLFSIGAGITDGSDVVFKTVIDKTFYDIIKETVEAVSRGVDGLQLGFGGIVTVDKYVAKIGDFTHESFDTYLEVNKSKLGSINSLYMDATFRDRGCQVLGDRDIVEDNYKANVRLKNATQNVTYTAKTFVKISAGSVIAYIYSQ